MQFFNSNLIPKIVQGKYITQPTSTFVVSSFSTDTRTIKSGDGFIALSGENFDAHDFVDKAAKQNAQIVIVEQAREEFKQLPVPILLVTSTVQALQDLAAYCRANASSKFIAITGSVGKTTTKEICDQLLNTTQPTLKSPKSYNNHLGVPLTLLEWKPHYKNAIVEIGTNAPGEIEPLSKLVKPHICLVTSVAPTHLEGFTSLEHVAQEKQSIVTGLEDNGVFITNGDNPYCQQMVESFSGKSKTYGFSSGNDYVIESYEENLKGIAFAINKEKFWTNIVGHHNLYNIAAAIAVAKECGLPENHLKEKLKNLQLPPMRMNISQRENITFVEDCYNASPNSVKAALMFLNHFAEQKKFVILESMLELGKLSSQFHYEIGKDLAHQSQKWSPPTYLVTSGKGDAQFFSQGAIENGLPGGNVLSYKDLISLAEQLRELLLDGGVVLLKASRKHQLEKLLPLLRDEPE